MKKIALLFFIVGIPTFPLELQKYFPQIDDTVTELIYKKQSPTNYLHILPAEVHAKFLLPYLKKEVTAGVVIGLLAGKEVTNTEFETRLAHISQVEASRLVQIPRLNGYQNDFQKLHDFNEMGLLAVEKDNVDELNFFYFKKRKQLIELKKTIPLRPVDGDWQISQSMRKIIDKRKWEAELSHLYCNGGVIIINCTLSILPLFLAGVWAYKEWPTAIEFDDCQRKYWDPIQDQSRATDYPCNITNIHLKHVSLWDCYNDVTTEICNSFKYHQIFINFLPLIAAVCMVAGAQGVLLLLKKFYCVSKPVLQTTHEYAVLYEQLVSQAQEDALPEVEEV